MSNMKHVLSVSLIGPERQDARNQIVDFVCEALRMVPYYFANKSPKNDDHLMGEADRVLIAWFGGVPGMDTTEVIRTMLLVVVVGMALLAFFYLSRRQLSWPAYLAWGLLATLLPVFGPFLVISLRPGRAFLRNDSSG